MQAILNNTGQITIPEPIRRQLRLQPGDAVEVVIGEAGEIKLLPVGVSITKLKGMLPQPAKPLSLEAMEVAIAKGAIDS
ncbi:AbrB/MazE/SpoVT family DNA-binding domain-containing protein [Methylomonas montana]|uniref:AbrB/MazE/SpoVT family DNA-binding domain-containing protein n=1 Tax=Methylomonas montana TaxID=3058963 RepID=UPI002658BD85|nr:AbrB/MazE/SpoVT family DNA-binding domain-containing protein [Methylomonas montana]WKJ90937.1 AbrB/MazE/SpoVT family DNA-binding domain-containing protein [Methylomonas montana]